MQKYSKGDHVKIVKDLGQAMSHFPSDCEAIVMYSYKEEYRGSDDKIYGLYIKGEGETSWYYEHQLILIKKKQFALLSKWKKGIKNESNLKKDIDWIFKNGKEVIKSSHNSSIETLASHLGINSLWGSRGEGFVYLQNTLMIINLAKPYLKKGDKEGWLKLYNKRGKNAIRNRFNKKKS